MASLTTLSIAVLLALCSAELTTDQLYDTIAAKFDNVYFDIRKIRSDVKEISEKIEMNGQIGQTDTCEVLKDRLESVKKETDAKFIKFEEEMNELIDKITNELTEKGYSRGGIISNVERNLQILQSAVKNGKKYSHDLMSSFEGRMENVERKIFAFENAPLKGDKGEVGMPGPRGRVGMMGIKGEKGQTGYNGINGQKGNKGTPSSKGEKGEIGIIGPRGFDGHKGQKGEKGEKGPLDFKAIQEMKGQEGSTESRYAVYFAVTFKPHKQTRLQLSSNKILHFDNILQNTGSGYSTANGKFTAPYSGVYLFIFFVETNGNKYNHACVKLYVNGHYYVYAIAEASYDYNDVSGGNAFVSYMVAGAEAWLQTCSSATHYICRYGSTFTGILLY
ncbi:complement C1q tumor necrosis factor-related protein 2-like [Ruditapes philippinarum]|uniref:complement C1q tumor necrosis factor-related protein 2-like n=1 Tax=Ruditapes philippinarum TaxID=129788 RepID=UPI00295B17CF|nr:complement C1q tumor necrosis factor-related protein 2-like [Ruditapes philippinarum]